MPTYILEFKTPLPVGYYKKATQTTHVVCNNLTSAIELQEKVVNELGPDYKSRLTKRYDNDEILQAFYREEDRLASGEYIRLPGWVPTCRIKDLPIDFTNKFSAPYDTIAHFAKRNKKTGRIDVAHSPTLDSLMRDRQIVVSFPAYLMQCNPEFTSDEINNMIAWLEQEFSPGELKFTRDPNLVAYIYTDFNHKAESSNYTSCMRYEPSEFELPDKMHPTKAYVMGNSTLSLAYMENQDGTITARAVVSEKNKLFVRVYGIEEIHKGQIKQALKEAGFEKKSSFKGEYIGIVPIPGEPNKILMPYIDGNCVWIDYDGLISDTGVVQCDTTAGTVELPVRFCQRTGVELKSDRDRAYVYTSDEKLEHLYEVWHVDVAKEHAFACPLSDNFFSKETTTTEKVVTKLLKGKPFYETVSRYAAVNYARRCDYTNARYSVYTFNFISVITELGPQEKRDTWCYEITPKTAYIKHPYYAYIYIKAELFAEFKDTPFNIGDLVYIRSEEQYHYTNYANEIAKITEITGSNSVGNLDTEIEYVFPNRAGHTRALVSSAWLRRPTPEEIAAASNF